MGDAIDPSSFTPKEIRNAIRKNQWLKSTSGVADGYVQANLVVLKEELALEFMQFCQRNPKVCPLLDVTDIGSSKPVLLAEDANIATDIGVYRIYREGILVEKVNTLEGIWEEDMIGFLLGCSLTFERALTQHGVTLQHYNTNSPVSMYKTNIPCVKAGRFEGTKVVSMRPIPEKDVVKVINITSKFPHAHGSPVHIGSPGAIGIKDISNPDFGKPVEVPENTVPIFWACGVTPQVISMEKKIDLMITHEPGYMFVSDIQDDELIF